MLAVLAAYLKTHLRYHPVNMRLYLANWSMKFYDEKLDRHVGFARHAQSIDEARADFERVKWVYDGDTRKRAADEPELLRQVWFTGDHSDVGGSYPENKSRLSDNALQWMLDQIKELPDPLLLDETVLRVLSLRDRPAARRMPQGPFRYLGPSRLQMEGQIPEHRSRRAVAAVDAGALRRARDFDLRRDGAVPAGAAAQP